MSVKFNPKFVRFAKAIAYIAAAILTFWMLWNWHEQIVQAILFAALGTFRICINVMLVTAGTSLILWFIPWVVTKYILEGVTPPKAPARVWKYAWYFSLGLGLLLTPANMYIHAQVEETMQPTASDFRQGSGCSLVEGFCWANEKTLEYRDQLASQLGTTRLLSWSVSDRDGDGHASINTSSIYLWKGPFFLL